MDKNYDLNLGKWGPYNKKYLGVCHIADEQLGATFNIELFPGFFRRTVMVSPSVSDNGVKMWGANPALTRFCYRYELEWKDRVYCDADFIITKDRQCNINCTFVNNTDIAQSVNMNVCMSMKRDASCSDLCRATFTDDCRIIDAVDYDDISCAQNFAHDGLHLGEKFVDGATGFGTVISAEALSESNSFLKYRMMPFFADSLGIRYSSVETVELNVIINEEECVSLTLMPSNGFEYATVSLPGIEIESIEIRPVSKGVDIDCICIGKNVGNIVFEKIPQSFESERCVEDNCITLKYKDTDCNYIIKCSSPIQMVRKLYCTDAGSLLQKKVHDHVSDILKGEGGGAYDNILTEPLFLEAGEHKTISFVITTAESDEDVSTTNFYTAYGNPDGLSYIFSQNMMAYTTFLNVVYPIYCRRGFIRHNTPGRYWDCLYTWDSGFIGMGLGTADFDRAYDCLNTYLTPVGDKHSPYIFHGSVVPTQIFLYQYLINKYPEKRERLKKLYPMIKQYYDFYANMDKGEEQMKSGLLKTWHIFYNSGGWDDYPAQKYIHEGTDGATPKNTTPVITTAVIVLIAKIMKLIARELGMGDNAGFDKAIDKYSQAIQSCLWDDECGYFSYMVHDNNGEAREFLRAPDGSNFNQGFDGIFPYIAGITTPHQTQKILKNISDGLMTDIGISVVDKRASYYSHSGYWNGSVWMPHQWILWKSFLDDGESTLAKEIADKALEVWKNEVDFSYCCFEHFMSANGRGAGFHHFSGLSTPVLMFFESYYCPGNITVGFSSIIKNVFWNEIRTECIFDCFSGNENSVSVVCMNSEKDYVFKVNGKETKVKKLTDGAYAVPLKAGNNVVKVIPKVK